MRDLGTMVCQMCGKETQRNSTCQKYCPACAVKKNREAMVRRNEAKRKGEKKQQKLIDKPCVGCGEIMHGVTVWRWYCDKCQISRMQEKNRSKGEQRKVKKRLQAEKAERGTITGLSIATINEIARIRGFSSYGKLRASVSADYVFPADEIRRAESKINARLAEIEAKKPVKATKRRINR